MLLWARSGSAETCRSAVRGWHPFQRAVFVNAPSPRCGLMNTVQRILLAGVGVLVASSSAVWAHHSYAMFDQTRKVTVHGTFKTLQWSNPHIWVWVDVDDGKGGTATYGFESNAPAELARFFGWNKRSLTAGDRITIDYSPLRSGKNGGALRTVTFADGRVLLTPRSDTNYVVGPPGGSPASSLGNPAN